MPNYVVPEKSQSDNREYRIFTLENELQVLLIHDETTEKASAAIGVGVGYHSDPEDAPGLAHLLEHMLFQGTEKYPASDAFSSFLAEHGGKSNAHTSGDETVYYFDVLHENLRGALEIWSQFFIAPLMNQEKTELELQAVDSENGKNLQSDPWRFNQLLRSRAKPGHPYTHFGTGNYQTLSSAPNLRERLLQFHDKYYSSNIMHLAILGREKLDDLESWAHEFFDQLRNTKVQRPTIPPDAFGPEQLQRILYTVPVKETSQITFTWPIPPQKDFYEKKPASYISHLVGHEAAGSILSLLKKKGWANELMAGPYQTADTFSLFKVDIELTNEGLEHVTEVAVIVYQYLKLVLEEGIKEWIYEENKFISEMRFRFKNKSEPFDYVQHLVDSMFNYPPQHVLTGVHLTTCFDRDLIKELLVQNFPPSNLRIHVSSKKFAGITDQVESWYGTPYKEEPFSADFVEKLKNPPPAIGSELYLPGVNALIPRDFELKSVTNEGDADLHILLENDLFHIYHKQDRTFLRPKANVYFSLTAPICYQSPRNAVLTRLWTNILEDSLNEFSYDAHLAGLEYSLSNTMAGCQLILKGFNDKIEVLAGKVLSKMAQLTIDDQRFDVLREKLSREFKNVNKEDQFKRALYNGNLILDHIRWHNDSYIVAVDQITADELRTFTSGMLGHLFIEGILHGNVTSEEAKKFARDIEEILKPKALLKVQIPEHRIVKIPKGNYIFREPGPNPENINQAVHNIYQIGMENAKESALLDLVSHILADPAYQQLRNVEQLGYIVWSFSSRSNGVQSYRVLIQSKTFTPDFLDDRIEQFLADAQELLASLTETEFRNFTASLAAEKLEKDKTLGQETNRYWREICNECYVFDRAQREVQAIEALTHEDLNQFFSKYIHPESQHRRKLSVQIWTRETLHNHENPNENGKGETPSTQEAPSEARPADEAATSRAETPNGATPAAETPNQEAPKAEQQKRVFQSTPVVIRDYVEWKRRQGVYPLPTPGVF